MTRTLVFLALGSNIAAFYIFLYPESYAKVSAESVIQISEPPLVSEDPEDINELTPGHLLIGKALNWVPEPSLLNLKEFKLSGWQPIQRMTQQFRQQWSSQYLHRLQSISKCHHPSHEIQVGSLILLTDKQSPPSKWPFARVTQFHPRTDNLTRVVTLKSATTQRPITKLAISPARAHAGEWERERAR